MSMSSHTVKRAFTLVELLVSIAVVTLLVTAVAAILSSATAVTGLSKKHLDDDSEARMIFDRMAGDFSHMVNRTDVDYIFAKAAGASSTIGANDSLFFYSEAPALANTSNSYTTSEQSTCALVGYRINSSYELERLGQEMVFGAAPPNGMVFLTYAADTTNTLPQPGTAAYESPNGAYAPNSSSTFANSAWSQLVGTSSDSPPYSTGTNTDYHVLGPDVFRLEYCFLLKPYKETSGTILPAVYSDTPYDTRTSPGPAYVTQYGLGMQDVQAIVVAIAILDAKSRAIVSTANLQTLAAALSDSNCLSGSAALTSSNTPVLMAQNWESEINPSNFTGLSKVAAQNVRIYQRTFYLSPYVSNP